jgi:hypothetical protein
MRQKKYQGTDDDAYLAHQKGLFKFCRKPSGPTMLDQSSRATRMLDPCLVNVLS